MSSLAWITSPSAVTTSAPSRSSIVTPFLRTRKPTPPASVMPPIPTEPGVAEAGDEPVLTGGDGVLAGGDPGLDRGGLGIGVDLERLHTGEIDHDSAVARAVAGAAVAAAADGELEAGSRARRDDRETSWAPATLAIARGRRS